MKNEQEIEVSLTRGGLRVDCYVLIGDKSGGFSVCYSALDGGLSIRHIEIEEDQRAHVAFLRKRGARQYPSLQDFARSHGDIRPAKAPPCCFLP
jgi:hypothetical protein